MLKLKSIIFLFLIHNSISFSWAVKILSDDDLRNFYILDSNISHTGIDASIQKITDGVHIYILKQINKPSLCEQFLLINDAIASTIAQDMGIHVNEVFFIPDNIARNLKIYPQRAATLHMYVSGKDLDHELPDYFLDDFNIHQRVIDQQSIWQQKWPLAQNWQGLTQAVIESMCLHEDLPPIVALDTFVGNIDRSRPNIFYDKQNNCFFGIDQAAVFENNLATFAYERLKELVEDGYFLTYNSKIIDGLRAYKNVLLQLKEKSTPFMIVQSMQELLPYLGPKVLQDGEVCSRMDNHEIVIKESYNAILELISFLDQI